MSKLKPWVWYGLAGHLCVGHRCRFHLCTKVNGYLVSTVGDYYDREDKRETIGAGDEDWFETMVFKAGQPCMVPGCGCGQPEISGNELECYRYTTAGDAQRGHLRFCRKYDRRACTKLRLPDKDKLHDEMRSKNDCLKKEKVYR